jgi:SAM-dependent methyltransferase
MRILDVGAGMGDLAFVLYTNRFKPEHYYAVDLKPRHVDGILALRDKVNFPVSVCQRDIRTDEFPYADSSMDVAVCFEVVEHFEQKYIYHPLEEIARVLKTDGTLLLSTPNYDGRHKAANHIYEYREQELQDIVEKYFHVRAKYGTFMSLGKPNQAKAILTPEDYSLFMRLHPYYNSSVLSVLFAPAYPSQSRNILWVLQPRRTWKEVALDPAYYGKAFLPNWEKE